jgi:hypothetical protein
MVERCLIFQECLGLAEIVPPKAEFPFLLLCGACEKFHESYGTRQITHSGAG